MSSVLHLFSAIKDNDFNTVKDMIETQGVDPNSKDKRGFTPLFLAIRSGNENIMNLLIDKGADVNYFTKMNDEITLSCLFLATLENKLNIVKLLLARGADPQNQYALKALEYAVHQGNTEITEALIDKGAAINAIDSNGKSLLMVAVVQNKLPMVELLLRKGIDETLTNNGGQTALDIARQLHRDEIVDVLEKYIQTKKTLTGVHVLENTPGLNSKTAYQELDFSTLDDLRDYIGKEGGRKRGNKSTKKRGKKSRKSRKPRKTRKSRKSKKMK